MAHVQTKFNPQEQGFHFVNYFNFSFIIDLPGVEPIDIGKLVYGLCGGMCFAALDHFYSELPIPDIREVSKTPEKLVDYLRSRQIDSLGITSLGRVIRWCLSDDEEVAKKTRRKEIPSLLKRLDQGEPVVIALIRANSLTDLTKNHQVLAVGYDLDPVARKLTVHLYEPNYPGKEPALTMNLGQHPDGLNIQQSTGEKARGFFIMRYRKKVPPPVAADTQWY